MAINMEPKDDPATSNTEEDEEDLEGYYSETDICVEPQYPIMMESFETTIVVTNLPKVPLSKLEKLKKVLTKLVGHIGPLAVSPDGSYSGLYMPHGESATHGVCLVEYENGENAKKAVAALQNYKFDKNHRLQVFPYEHSMMLEALNTERFDAPAPSPFQEPVDTTSWYEDKSQRDEFVVRQGKETVVYWSDGRSDPIVDYDGRREKAAGVSWCEFYVHWSPNGSYLATLVPSKGVILWGGANYEKIGRFPASGVQFVIFSPRENYMLTNNNNAKDPAAIKVFHIQSGKLLRSFPLYPPDFPQVMEGEESTAIPPPPFHWSYDDRYLARMGKDLISIYETPNMKLLDRRSLSTNGIHEFQWSPGENIIAYWAPEVGNAPAHVDLVSIPSRKSLRQKNLFNVTKCSMVWQSEGSFLGVKVTRHTKSKKTLYNNLELFRMKETGIPVEMLDIKDAVMAFAWEPRGTRFSIIHAENPSSTKVNVSFYDMRKKVDAAAQNPKNKPIKKNKPATQILAELNKVETLSGKQCNCLFWSPAGGVIILAGLGDSASGTLEFYDVDDKTLVVKEHYRANAVLWDPSGRTVVTTVSQPIEGGHFKFAMDNGYILWSFQGKQLYQQSFETFYQLQWRPRERLLAKNQIESVVKDLKKYEKIFDKADRERSKKMRLEETKEKRALRSKFRARMARLKAFRNSQRSTRMDLQGGYDSQDENHYTTTSVVLETVLDEKNMTVTPN